MPPKNEKKKKIDALIAEGKLNDPVKCRRFRSVQSTKQQSRVRRERYLEPEAFERRHI